MRFSIQSKTVLLVTALLFGCAEKKNDVKALLENPATQNEVMETIVQDHRLMQQMMHHISQNEHALMMMRSDTMVMHHVMAGGRMGGMMHGDAEMTRSMMNQMMTMAAKDSVVCQMMKNSMMGNAHMRQMMHDMMSDTLQSGHMHMNTDDNK